MSRNRVLGALATRGGAVLLLAGALVACEGDNLFQENPIGPGGAQPGGQSGAVRDTVAPTEVKLLAPLPDAVVAAGEPLLARVSVKDDLGLDSVVVSSVTPGGDGKARYARIAKVYAAGDTVRVDTASLSLRSLGPEPADKALVIASAFDRGRNVSSDTLEIVVVSIRGTLIPLDNEVDQIVDIATDGARVFLSNFSRHRVEVLDVNAGSRGSFRVGSQPWGLAVSEDEQTLYVANSGGTNISVVALGNGAVPLQETGRISTPNTKLFSLTFSYDSVDVNGVKERHGIPKSGEVYDYSDRPQFIATTAGGQLLYSTRPTGSAPDGTIRRWDPGTGKVELFVDYAEPLGVGDTYTWIFLNAADVHTEGDPKRVSVLPEGATVPIVDWVENLPLRLEGTGVKIVAGLDPATVGLTDTTFVAVSGDHRTVAFGEGASNVGRIMLFRETGSEGADAIFSRVGDTDDLVRNASERVIGLALNQDGSLGAARGGEAYFFDPSLRLQGVGVTGTPQGGLAFHPGHTAYGRSPESPSAVAFVSGLDDNGVPYIDVLDTKHFVARERIFLRAPVTGPLVAVPSGVSGGLSLFGISGSKVIRVDLGPEDLQR